MDNTLPYGKTRKEKSGSNGYKVDTYVKVTEDGVVVRNEKITTSTYNPKKEVLFVSGQSAPTELPETTTPTNEPKTGGSTSPIVMPPSGFDENDMETEGTQWTE